MRLFLFLSLILPTVICPARAQTVLPGIDVNINSGIINVRVSVTGGDATAQALARKAFGSHGRYALVESGFKYDIKLSVLAGNQVRVDVVSGATTIASQTFPGDPTFNPRNPVYNALLKACDFAVEKTNGLGLKGFFASRIAFVGEATGKKEIYTADLFFTPGSVRQETRDRVQVLTPRWSPDGNQLVYTSYLKGVPDIYLITLSGNARAQDLLVSVQGTNLAGPFSPNGRKLLAVLTGTGRPEIWVRDMLTGHLDPLTNQDSVKSSPVWSPDGSQIIFAMSPGPQLYRMSASGGMPRKIQTNSGLANEPSWSRASPNKVAYTIQEAKLNRIAMVDLSTGATKTVSPGNFYAANPVWLADGRHLVYTVQNGSQSRLHILDTETGKSTAISDVGGGVEPASQASVWAP